MAEIDEGGAAFPGTGQYGEDILIHPGMTLRDWFAGQALNIILRDKKWVPSTWAKDAYTIADEMLSARNAKP